eukprot:TRINITY_DN5728_c0_g2_i1.p1 TRINITY_DN5728_c0_g2~~TRINITY_DN5728_c0_g2_i1.p1  ORF type:complete len:1105 (+),score=220.67 TRINITY_DN5728_c0_g2_i1:77-3391(+)
MLPIQSIHIGPLRWAQIPCAASPGHHHKPSVLAWSQTNIIGYSLCCGAIFPEALEEEEEDDGSFGASDGHGSSPSPSQYPAGANKSAAPPQGTAGAAAAASGVHSKMHVAMTRQMQLKQHFFKASTNALNTAREGMARGVPPAQRLMGAQPPRAGTSPEPSTALGPGYGGVGSTNLPSPTHAHQVKGEATGGGVGGYNNSMEAQARAVAAARRPSGAGPPTAQEGKDAVAGGKKQTVPRAWFNQWSQCQHPVILVDPAMPTQHSLLHTPHTSSITHLSFSPAHVGRYLVTADSTRLLCVWECARSKHYATNAMDCEYVLKLDERILVIEWAKFHQYRIPRPMDSKIQGELRRKFLVPTSSYSPRGFRAGFIVVTENGCVRFLYHPVTDARWEVLSVTIISSNETISCASVHFLSETEARILVSGDATEGAVIVFALKLHSDVGKLTMYCQYHSTLPPVAGPALGLAKGRALHCTSLAYAHSGLATDRSPGGRNSDSNEMDVSGSFPGDTPPIAVEHLLAVVEEAQSHRPGHVRRRFICRWALKRQETMLDDAFENKVTLQALGWELASFAEVANVNSGAVRSLDVDDLSEDVPTILLVFADGTVENRSVRDLKVLESEQIKPLDGSDPEQNSPGSKRMKTECGEGVRADPFHTRAAVFSPHRMCLCITEPDFCLRVIARRPEGVLRSEETTVMARTMADILELGRMRKSSTWDVLVGLHVIGGRFSSGLVLRLLHDERMLIEQTRQPRKLVDCDANLPFARLISNDVLDVLGCLCSVLRCVRGHDENYFDCRARIVMVSIYHTLKSSFMNMSATAITEEALAELPDNPQKYAIHTPLLRSLWPLCEWVILFSSLALTSISRFCREWKEGFKPTAKNTGFFFTFFMGNDRSDEALKLRKTLSIVLDRAWLSLVIRLLAICHAISVLAANTGVDTSIDGLDIRELHAHLRKVLVCIPELPTDFNVAFFHVFRDRLMGRVSDVSAMDYDPKLVHSSEEELIERLGVVPPSISFLDQNAFSPAASVCKPAERAQHRTFTYTPVSSASLHRNVRDSLQCVLLDASMPLRLCLRCSSVTTGDSMVTARLPFSPFETSCPTCGGPWFMLDA